MNGTEQQTRPKKLHISPQYTGTLQYKTITYIQTRKANIYQSHSDRYTITHIYQQGIFL